MRPTRADRRSGQRGAAGLLVLVGTLALAVPAAAGLGRVGSAARERARVDAVADLTALAAALDGRPGAEQVARANGAALVGLDGSGPVVVRVRDGSVEGTAAAVPTPWTQPRG